MEEETMNDTAPIAPQQKAKRIGILLSGLEKANLPVLHFLVLYMNSLQSTFEYEFLPTAPQDELIQMLSAPTPINREEVRAKTPAFIERYRDWLEKLIVDYELREPPPEYFVIVGLAHFSDNFYTMRQGPLSVLALGNWDRVMAPPSLLEFILTLIVRESVAAISESLRSSIHLGTKGCLCDFTLSLTDVRYKIFNGFICQYCRAALQHDGLPGVADELTRVLGRKWLGNTTDSNSPASIALKLGYNLFTTKGLEATKWEKFLSLIQEEGIKQFITIIGAIIIAVSLILLGLK
jgi:hypothetical protein